MKFKEKLDKLIGENNMECPEEHDPVFEQINHLLEVVSLRTRIQMLEDELRRIKGICDHDPAFQNVG